MPPADFRLGTAMQMLLHFLDQTRKADPACLNSITCCHPIAQQHAAKYACETRKQVVKHHSDFRFRGETPLTSKWGPEFRSKTPTSPHQALACRKRPCAFQAMDMSMRIPWLNTPNRYFNTSVSNTQQPICGPFAKADTKI